MNWPDFSGLFPLPMFRSEFTVKIVAGLFGVIGSAGVISGIMGLMGSPLLGLSPWLLSFVGGLFLMSSYGLLTRHLDEV